MVKISLNGVQNAGICPVEARLRAEMQEKCWVLRREIPRRLSKAGAALKFNIFYLFVRRIAEANLRNDGLNAVKINEKSKQKTNYRNKF